MTEKYLTINAGSSSLKFGLYEMPKGTEIVSGIVEKIGNNDSSYTLKYSGNKKKTDKVILNHEQAVETILSELLKNKFISSIDEIEGVGHRVLHGGEFYSNSVLIDDEVLGNIESLIKLGPLHQPGAITGIKCMMKYLPDVANVAVFDTAFHQTMNEEEYRYAVPKKWYEENGVRKYGFHGTSHKYITEVMKNKFLKDDVNLIICHLGSGASISAIKDGNCINTSMGLTPLDGLVMGTRSGSIDPSMIEYIAKERNMTISQVMKELNNSSGLKGICGKNDYRDVAALAADGNEDAILAINMFKKSIVNYIAQYYFELNGKVDAIIFTAGIGENVSSLREDIVNTISIPMGIKLDKEMNDNIAGFKKIKAGQISTDDSKIKVLVEPTNEELMILIDTYKIVVENEKNQKRVLVR